MSKVFFPYRSTKFDLSPAEEYGQIRFFLPFPINPFDTDLVVAKLSDAILAEGFDPEQDYIGMTGQTLIISLMTGIVFSMCNKVSLLFFDANVSKYRVRVIDLATIKGERNGEE